MNSVRFCLPENVFISLLFLKDTLTVCRILGNSYSSSSLKMLLHCLLVYVGYDEKLGIVFIIVPLYLMFLFFFNCFQNFLFIFGFQRFNFNMACVVLSVLILLRILWASWSCELNYLKFWKNLDCYFFKYFSATLLISSLSGIWLPVC